MNAISQNIEQYKLFNAYTQSNYQNENNLLGGGSVSIAQSEVNSRFGEKSSIQFGKSQFGRNQFGNNQFDSFTPSYQFKSIKEKEAKQNSDVQNQPNGLNETKIGSSKNTQETENNKNKTKEETKAEAKQKGELTEEEQKVVEKLKQRDSEVKAHEQAHLAAAGGLAKGGPSYTYQVGPDGKQYAIGGEVQIDTSPGSTPEETIAKMQQVRRAALAPAQPSGQDISVANGAAKMEAEARAQLREQNAEEAKPKDEKQQFGNQNSIESKTESKSETEFEDKTESKVGSKSESKTESKIDFSNLLNNKYGLSNKSDDNENNKINSKNNEFSIINNKTQSFESLGGLVDFKVQSKMVAGLSCCSGMSGCMMCAPKPVRY